MQSCRRTIIELILPRLGVCIVLHLPNRRLADVDIGELGAVSISDFRVGPEHKYFLFSRGLTAGTR